MRLIYSHFQANRIGVYNNEPMHMIGHRHKQIECHVLKMRRQLLPALCDNNTGIAQLHLSMRNRT